MIYRVASLVKIICNFSYSKYENLLFRHNTNPSIFHRTRVNTIVLRTYGHRVASLVKIICNCSSSKYKILLFRRNIKPSIFYRTRVNTIELRTYGQSEI